jgi:hypothetical protein
LRAEASTASSISSDLELATRPRLQFDGVNFVGENSNHPSAKTRVVVVAIQQAMRLPYNGKHG